MDDKLYESLVLLKEGIEKDPRVIRLNELDEKLNHNEEVMVLSYKKDTANTFYNDALKFFKEDSKEVKDAQKALYEAKLNLNNHPLVKEYNEAYKEVRLLYEMINKELFNDFNLKGKHQC